MVCLKTCRRCKVAKPSSEFNVRRKTLDQLQPFCRECQSANHKAYYQQSPERHIDKQRRRRVYLWAINRPRVAEYLAQHPCVDCGEQDPLVLDFDHRDPGTKHMNVAEMLYDYPWHRVAAEIDKCDVRCANCHRRRTAVQLGWATRPRG